MNTKTMMRILDAFLEELDEAKDETIDNTESWLRLDSIGITIHEVKDAIRWYNRLESE